MLPFQTLFLVSKNSMYLKENRWFLWAIRTFFWPDPTPAKSHSFFLWLAMFNLATIFELSTTSSVTDAFCFPGTALVPYRIYTYFYISSDSFVLFGGNILHKIRINCLKSWVRLWLFEGKSGAKEELIKMRGDYVLICEGDKWLIPLAY